MTTRAYQEIYLSKAQAALGDAFDYAINACHITGSDFVKLFTASSVSRRMENGEPALLAGKSGIEIAADVLLETTGKHPETEPQEHFGRSREYWIGWAVCYYQWFSARSYSDIFNVLSYDHPFSSRSCCNAAHARRCFSLSKLKRTLMILAFMAYPFSAGWNLPASHSPSL